MSEYEDILDNSTGAPSGNKPVTEGFQKILVKEIEPTEFTKYHDIGLDITIAPTEYPEWDIRETISGDWNLQADSSPTIWKVTNVIDRLINTIYGEEAEDINAKALFDTTKEPPRLLADEIAEINEDVNQTELYGYLFESKQKNGKADAFFWRCHYLITDTEEDEQKVVDSFQNWKTNKMVQQHYIFKDEVEEEEDFNYGDNAEDKATVGEGEGSPFKGL